MANDRLLTEREIVIRLNGSPRYVGVIAATTTSKNNNDTGVPFLNTGDGLSATVLELQPDVACHVVANNTAALAVATTNDTKLEAGEKYVMVTTKDQKFLGCRSVTGSVNLLVRIKD